MLKFHIPKMRLTPAEKRIKHFEFWPKKANCSFTERKDRKKIMKQKMLGMSMQ